MTDLRVLIFDDVLAARGERFAIPGLDVTVHADADRATALCEGEGAPHVVCMDYAMGAGHVSGAEAIRALRGAGFPGRIVAMSSDPSANQTMLHAGADEVLDRKAMLRSYLVAIGKARGG